MAFNPFSDTGSILGTLNADPNSGISQLANRLLNFLLFLVYPVAFAGLVYTAYLLITSAGNPDAWAKAKKNIAYMVIGIFIIVFASIFVSLFRRLFGT